MTSKKINTGLSNLSYNAQNAKISHQLQLENILSKFHKSAFDVQLFNFRISFCNFVISPTSIISFSLILTNKFSTNRPHKKARALTITDHRRRRGPSPRPQKRANQPFARQYPTKRSSIPLPLQISTQSQMIRREFKNRKILSL